MKFVDEIDFGGVSLFVLTAHHEVHLLQLVEESNALLCDMSAFALLQDMSDGEANCKISQHQF